MHVWMLSMYGCVLWLYAINVCLHIFACVRSPHPLACLSSECLFWLTLALSVSQDCLSLEGCEPKTRLLSLLFVSSFCLYRTSKVVTSSGHIFSREFIPLVYYFNYKFSTSMHWNGESYLKVISLQGLFLSLVLHDRWSQFYLTNQRLRCSIFCIFVG